MARKAISKTLSQKNKNQYNTPRVLHSENPSNTYLQIRPFEVFFLKS